MSPSKAYFEHRLSFSPLHIKQNSAHFFRTKGTGQGTPLELPSKCRFQVLSTGVGGKQVEKQEVGRSADRQIYCQLVL